MKFTLSPLQLGWPKTYAELAPHQPQLLPARSFLYLVTTKPPSIHSRWALSPVYTWSYGPPVSRIISPQFHIYKVIFMGCNSIYNKARGPPCWLGEECSMGFLFYRDRLQKENTQRSSKNLKEGETRNRTEGISLFFCWESRSERMNWAMIEPRRQDEMEFDKDSLKSILPLFIILLMVQKSGEKTTWDAKKNS